MDAADYLGRQVIVVAADSAGGRFLSVEELVAALNENRGRG